MESTGSRRWAVLRGLCDVFVPAVRRAEDPDGFWQRRASDLGVERAVERYVLGRVPEPDREGLLRLLDVLGRAGFARAPKLVRAGMLRALAASSADAARGLAALRSLTLMFFYALPGDGGLNPNWKTIGYPGPPRAAPGENGAAGGIRPFVPEGLAVALEADACVVGSGAGGGVVAAELAASGLKVVVLEAGDRLPDGLKPYELDAFEDLYRRGGYTPTDDANAMTVSGRTLGGGTAVNWMNCVAPASWVREEWAADHGLEGLAGEDFDRHLGTVLGRISANGRCSDRNGPNQRLKEGSEALGYAWRPATLNVDPDRYDPLWAAHTGFGDRSGAKQDAVQTYLRDAVDNGADVLVRCRAGRVLVENGRAAGVEAVYRGEDGRRVAVTVRAPRVVVAGGALETPALLLRSGIGGPAVGRYLRLHPCVAVVGFYEEEQRSWWGPPHAGIVHEFANLTGGYGFLVECVHFYTGVLAASVPWVSGRDHKEIMSKTGRSATFIGPLRERGYGRVTADAAGEPVVTYPLNDGLDLRHLRAELGALARIHAAAGAEEILDLSPGRPVWRRGEDLGAFVRHLEALPFGRGGRLLFSAHQMGTARMGKDPGSSVADPWGELHDVPGVWVGDTSAFPTSLGSNPMLTCMALAQRTAEEILVGKGLRAGAV